MMTRSIPFLRPLVRHKRFITRLDPSKRWFNIRSSNELSEQRLMKFVAHCSERFSSLHLSFNVDIVVGNPWNRFALDSNKKPRFKHSWMAFLISQSDVVRNVHVEPIFD